MRSDRPELSSMAEDYARHARSDVAPRIVNLCLLWTQHLERSIRWILPRDRNQRTDRTEGTERCGA